VAEARFAATDEIRRANDLRHVRVRWSMIPEPCSSNPAPQRSRRWASHQGTALLKPTCNSDISRRLPCVPLGELRVSSNPMSESRDRAARGAGFAVLHWFLLR